MNKKNGFVIWVTGLAGSGKSTISDLLNIYIKKKFYLKTIHLDGDVLRQIFHNNKYSIEERKKISFQYCKLCDFLSKQNLNVIISTISMFDEVRLWNRKNINNYFEIYLKTSIKTLIDRDKNNLYSKALNGEIKNVIGIDIEYQEPKNSDIILINNNKETINTLYNQLISNNKLKTFLGNN